MFTLNTSKNFCASGMLLFFTLTIYLLSPAYAENQKKLQLVIPLFAGDAKLEPEYVAQLNQYIKDDDIIAVRGKPQTIRLIKEIKKGKIAIIRQSLADLEKDIRIMNSEGVRFDYLCYNPEDYPTSRTPDKEKEDIVAAARKAQILAKKHGVKLIIAPDTKKTLPKYGAQMAVYADIFAIQFQAYQLLPDAAFRRKVEESVRIVRMGNPNIPIIAQLSTNPPTGKTIKGKGKIYTSVTVTEISSKVESIRDIVNGIGFLIFSEDNGLERFKEFLKKRHEM